MIAYLRPRRRSAAALLILAFFVQRPAHAWPKQGCLAVLVSAAVGVTGYVLYPSPPQPSMEVVVPDGVRATRSDTDLRIERFDKLLVAGEVKIGLATPGGGAPRLVVFTQNFTQKLIAGRVKAELVKLHPELANEPWVKAEGITIVLTKLTLAQDPSDRERVFVLAGGQFTQLKSEVSFRKDDLLSGKPLLVEFTPVVQSTEGNGEFKVDARIALQFSAASSRFEVLSGKVAVSLKVPDVVDEEHRVPVAPFHSDRIAVSPP